MRALNYKRANMKIIIDKNIKDYDVLNSITCKVSLHEVFDILNSNSIDDTNFAHLYDAHLYDVIFDQVVNITKNYDMTTKDVYVFVDNVLIEQ